MKQVDDFGSVVRGLYAKLFSETIPNSTQRVASPRQESQITNLHELLCVFSKIHDANILKSDKISLAGLMSECKD